MLLMPENRHVHGNQTDDERREQKDVREEQPPGYLRRRKRAAEEQRLDPDADERNRHGDRGGDPQACSRQEIVGQRVSREAGAQREQKQREPDDPVDLARLAKMRAICVTIAAQKSSADQWWIWRIMSPACVSKEMRIVEA